MLEFRPNDDVFEVEPGPGPDEPARPSRSGQRLGARGAAAERRSPRAAKSPKALKSTSPADARTARELLAEFARSGDERAFEEVVRRYAGMVHSVCMRVTKNAHDAEDAAQAVFLALAMQVKTRPDQPLQFIGPWLQQVARRLALDMRRSKTRRTNREEKLADLQRQRLGTGRRSGNGHASAGPAGPSEQFEQEELRTLVAEELQKLPSKYRLPLILHYFGGLSRDEMARELRIKPNTLGVRVFRGRDLLGKRLERRGIILSGAVIAVLLGQSLRSLVSDSFIASTVSAAGTLAGSPASISAALPGATAAATAQMVPAHAAVTAQQVGTLLRSIGRGMLLARLKVLIVGVILFATVAAGGAQAVSRVARHFHWHLPAPLQWDVASQLRKLLMSVLRPPQLSSAADATDASDSRPTSHALPRRSGRHPDSMAAAPEAPAQKLTDSARSSVVASNVFGGWPPALPPPLDGRSSLARRKIQSILPVPPAQRPPPPPVTIALHPALRPASAAPSPADVAAPARVIGAAPGRSESASLGDHQVLNGSSLVVGDAGAGAFNQFGAASIHHLDQDLILGLRTGSSGRYVLAGRGSRLEVEGDEIVGDHGAGQFIHTDGVNLVDGKLVVGRQGRGQYEQSGGTTHAGGGTVVAQLPGSTGDVSLTGGEFSADPQLIGNGGTGSLHQTGGTNTAGTVWVAPDRGSSGSYALRGGTLLLDSLTSVTDRDVYHARNVSVSKAGINVGGAGDGNFRMGSINKKARIIELQQGAYLAVRAKESGSGVFRGWGGVGVTGEIVNNGQIVADGYGAPHALDLSSASGVINTIENLPVGGTNGWFARNGGELLLPPVSITAGSGTYSWGESADDALPDLVNSVRFHVSGADSAGHVRISLLSLDRAGVDVPAFPQGHHFIGVWSFSSDVPFDGLDLAVRYDDAAAAAAHLDEKILKLWRFDPAQSAWIRINDASFRRYEALNIVAGHAGNDDSLTYFAVSAPEPTMLAPMTLAGWLLLRRRRKAIAGMKA